MTKYLTPEKLGLSLRQYSALVATQFLLESGLLVHKEWQKTKPGDYAFDMSMWCESMHDSDENGEFKTCGTLQCIGGTMEWLLGGESGLFLGEKSIISTYEENDALRDLFFPGHMAHRRGHTELGMALEKLNWESITPEQGAKAIKNYRVYGDARWDSILDVSPETFEVNDEQD